MNLIIFGAPGSGKGTQGSNLAEHYGLAHISTGELLRKEIADQSPLGLTAKEYIDHGQLVPDYLIIEIIDDFLLHHTESKGFILDGFPRTVTQAKALDEMMAKRDDKIHMVIDLQVPEEELIQRLLNRGKVSGRSDDNLETIKKRLQTYQKQTASVADFYEEKAIHHPFKGIGSIDQITASIKEAIDKIKD